MELSDRLISPLARLRLNEALVPRSADVFENGMTSREKLLRQSMF